MRGQLKVKYHTNRTSKVTFKTKYEMNYFRNDDLKPELSNHRAVCCATLR